MVGLKCFCEKLTYGGELVLWVIGFMVLFLEDEAVDEAVFIGENGAAA